MNKWDWTECVKEIILKWSGFSWLKKGLMVTSVNTVMNIEVSLE